MKLTNVIARAGQPPVLHIRRAELEVVEGPSAGLCVAFDGKPLRMGSGPGCDLTLADASVSRLHAELRLDREAVILRDLQSSNGTFVNGIRILAAELGENQVFRMGHSDVRFTVSGKSAPVDLWPHGSFGELLGKSVVMRQIFALLDRLAHSDASVLLLGETGTGKDLAASAIHEASPRAAGPFVVVDCGAIPENLMEGELFGAVKGAFTGAARDRPGGLEQAHGGTLFLDEVGELPLTLQPKILRFLDHRRVKRLGESQYREVDTRIVAATNRPLHKDVEQGSFREDLFYRLHVIHVELPPLRERTEDIPMLARRFARRLLRRLPDQSIDDVVPADAVAALTRHGWPGNVRELLNHVQRMMALADPHVQPGLTPHPGAAPAGQPNLELPFRQSKDQAVRQFEHQYLRQLLARSGDNISQAARLGAMDRAHLYKLLRKHQLI